MYIVPTYCVLLINSPIEIWYDLNVYKQSVLNDLHVFIMKKWHITNCVTFRNGDLYINNANF
jgi:hypothetical protein